MKASGGVPADQIEQVPGRQRPEDHAEREGVAPQRLRMQGPGRDCKDQIKNGIDHTVGLTQAAGDNCEGARNHAVEIVADERNDEQPENQGVTQRPRRQCERQDQRGGGARRNQQPGQPLEGLAVRSAALALRFNHHR